MSSSVVVVLFLSNTSDADGSLGAKGKIRGFSFFNVVIPKNPQVYVLRELHGPGRVAVSNWNFSITSLTAKKWPKRRPRRPFFSSTIGVANRIPHVDPVNMGVFSYKWWVVYPTKPMFFFSGSKNDQHLGWVLGETHHFFGNSHMEQ